MNADASKTTEPGRGSFPVARRASLARLDDGEPGVERVAGVRAPGVVGARARGVWFGDDDGGRGGVSSTAVSRASSSSGLAAAACPISSHIAADAASCVARTSFESFGESVTSRSDAFAVASRALASFRRRQLLGRDVLGAAARHRRLAAARASARTGDVRVR